MSYSFSVRAATKSEAIDAVYEELNQVAVKQHLHRLDVYQAQRCASEIIGALAADDAKDVGVSMSGSIATETKDGVPISTSVSVSINAYLAVRPVKQ